MQLVPKLEGIEELLNMPLDEDCLEKLLSRDDADEIKSTAKVGRAALKRSTQVSWEDWVNVNWLAVWC